MAGRSWELPVPDLDWTCERTLQHLIKSEIFYAMHVALPLDVLQRAAVGASPFIAGSRTDIEGVTALACDELLVHTWDIGRGLERHLSVFRICSPCGSATLSLGAGR